MKYHEIIRLRMRLIPYLYMAFLRFQENGVPRFRALVMDDSADPVVWHGRRQLTDALLSKGTSR